MDQVIPLIGSDATTDTERRLNSLKMRLKAFIEAVQQDSVVYSARRLQSLESKLDMMARSANKAVFAAQAEIPMQ